MFKIQLSPIASDHDTAITIDGFNLTYDGVTTDFSVIPTDGQADAIGPAVGTIINDGGDILVTLECHYNSATAVKNQSADLVDYYVEVTAGEVPDVIERLADV